jgi:DNA repair protein RecN (Recombination protein N)
LAGVAGIAARGCRRGESRVELHSQAAGALARVAGGTFALRRESGRGPRAAGGTGGAAEFIHSLKRKYGATLAEVIAFGDEAKQKLQALESRDAELARLNAALENWTRKFLSAGKKLSAARESNSALARAVGRQLEDLGFKQSKFDVAISDGSSRRVGPEFRSAKESEPSHVGSGHQTNGLRRN